MNLRHKHQCATPLNALQLEGDMERILTALNCIQRVDPDSINKDRKQGWKDRTQIIFALKSWHLTARERLRTEYLCS